MGVVVSFANIDGSCSQTPNPGGARHLLVALAKDIVGAWPKPADITAGEITTLPTMVSGKKFSMYEFPNQTCDIMSQSTGDPGYAGFSHSVNFSLAGYSAVLVDELSKHRNAGSVFIVEQNDGQYCVVGCSDRPIFLKSDFKTGKKGADKRGFDLKGTQDGLMFDITPLKATLVATIPVNV
jgi:hypothetical protein